MANNVSDLEEKGEKPYGKPLEVDLNKIDADPNQPRKDIKKETLKELADSIKLRNVKQPISIRLNPAREGRYLINAGERRFRASILAGKSTIPAFIDETFEDYDQIIENEQRENLTAMELALFIDKKSKEGTPKLLIAKYLSRTQNVITDHLAMIDMPDPIAGAYRTGRVRTAKTINELKKIYKLDPVAVSEWIGNVDFITRGNVQAIRKRLLEPARARETVNVAPLAKRVIKQESYVQQPEVHHDSDKVARREITAKEFEHRKYVAANKIQVENAKGIHNPLLLVKYDDKRASIMLNKFPSVQGRIWIRFDDGNEMEVGASALQIISLSDK